MQAARKFLRLTSGALLLSYLFTCSGCALLFQPRHTVLITAQDSTQLKIQARAFSPFVDDPGDQTIMATGRRTKFPIYNRLDFYNITQTKPGYLPYTMPIEKTGFNLGKGIDIALSGIGDIILLAVVSAGGEPSAAGLSAVETVPAYYFGVFGWLHLLAGPWKVFPGQAILPGLVKIPYRTDDENKLYIKSVGVDIKKKGIKKYYYKNFNAYKNKEATVSDAEEGAIKYRNTIFNDTLNHILADWNYEDQGNQPLSKLLTGSYYLQCQLNDFNIIIVSTYVSISFKCEWKIYGTTSSKEIFGSSTDCVSSWKDFHEHDINFDEFATDVLQRSMAQFLITPEVQKCLHDKSATSNVIQKWVTIPVNSSTKDSVANLNEAIEAVATVVVPDGHGSGCVISPDGYLITNFHVVADDTAGKVKLLFSNGDSVNATYVRSNAEYDLAVLKIDKPGTYKYFNVDTAAKAISVGDNVYAIGTPENILLGQTLTRGILSGERKTDNKTLIQTDVSINPGNSGGALVTPKGRLLGIVNAKIAGIGVQGVGFAIPAYYIDDALKINFHR